MNLTLKSLTRWTPLSGSLIALIIMVLVITPVILNQLIPLNDYPFHLARIIILSDLDNPVYSQFYKQGSFLLPNMAMDMIAVPLANFVGSETASRIFVMLCLLSMLGGTMMLHKGAHKRFSPWPLLAVSLLFNGIFRFGFLNYIFGVGVAFFVAGLWLCMRPCYFRMLFTLLASLLLVLLHFSAFAVFAIIIGSFEIHTAYLHWRIKGSKSSIFQLLVAASPFLFVIALFILLSPTAEVANQGIAYPSFLGAKPLGALYSILTGIKALDIFIFSSIVITFSFLLSTKRIQFSPPLILAFFMMSLAFMVLPSSMMGAFFVDVRLGPAIALLGIAAIDIKADSINSNRLVACLAVLIAILISTNISTQWHDFNNKTSKIIKAFNKTEEGATIFCATTQPFTHLITDSPERRAAWNPPLKHVASYAVLTGPKFVPMTFVNPTQQPLNIVSKYKVVKEFQGDTPRKTYTAHELEIFLLEIKEKLLSKSWPQLDNVYVFVMGFDRIQDNFNLGILKGWGYIAELKNDHILIKINLMP